MALFNDSGLLGITDLEIYEANLSKIASTHGINLDSKTIITLSQIGDRVLSRLVRCGSVNTDNLGLGWERPSRITVRPPQNRWVFTLDNVVVTAPLQRWMCYQVLAQTFSEAYSTQLNDRFKAKWNEYLALSQDAERNFYELGIGVVYQPLSKPAEPQIAVISGPAPGGIVVVQTAWADGNGEESALSDLMPVTLPQTSSLVVSMADAANPVPVAAIGWNIYIGANGAEPTRQNLVPIDLGTAWSLPDNGFLSGPLSVGGQQPDCYIVDSQRLQRG